MTEQDVVERLRKYVEGGTLYAHEGDIETVLRRLETCQQENERLCGIPEMADQHAETWKYEPVSVWLAGLQEEVAELTLAIEGEHEGPVEHELRQIGSIALNWLRKFAALEEQEVQNEQ